MERAVLRHSTVSRNKNQLVQYQPVAEFLSVESVVRLAILCMPKVYLRIA
jgi:hypothetical protein